MYHIDRDHEYQLEVEKNFNSNYLSWVDDYIKQHLEIERNASIRTGAPNGGRIEVQSVFRRVFFCEADETGLPSIYLGYQAMWDSDRNVLVVRHGSELGKELRRLHIEDAESVTSSYGYPDYVGVRILEPDVAGQNVEKIFCYGRCPSIDLQSTPEPHQGGPGQHIEPDITSVKLDYPEATHSAANAPKTGHSPLVGGTLQGDQLELLDAPFDNPLFVQGPPGSGKTVIAVFRACDVAYEEAPSPNQVPKRVLLIGPTDRYVSFVMPLNNRLVQGDSGHFDVKSLQQLIFETAGTSRDDVPAIDLTGPGSSRGVAEIIEVFHQTQRWDYDPDYDDLHEAGRQQSALPSRKSRPELFHNALRKYAESQAMGESSSWIAHLPTYTTSRRKSETQAFLALSRTYTSPREAYDYIVVDEAQDMPWIGWQIISRLLQRNEQISAFGDFDQGKAGAETPRSWREVSEVLGLPPETPVETLTRSFRCTQAIMKFASQKCGQPALFAESLRRGSAVTQMPWRGFNDSGERLLTELQRLCTRVAPGVVAISTLSTEPVENHLVENGYTLRDLTLGKWGKGEEVLLVLSASDVASLEFDALIVLGFKEIIETLGNGTAFTLLTRPAKELTVFL